MTVTKIGEEFISLLHKRSPEAGSPRLEEGLSDVIRSLSSICLATRASSVSFYFLIDQEGCSSSIHHVCVPAAGRQRKEQRRGCLFLLRTLPQSCP